MLAPIKLAANRSEADLLAASQVFQDDFVAAEPGVLRRELVRTGEATYIDIVQFRSKADMEDVMEKEKASPVCHAFFAVMDMSAESESDLAIYPSLAHLSLTMEPFKNNISPRLVGLIADQLDARLKRFDRSSFEGAVLAELDDLELKDRARLIADRMHDVLPASLGKRNKLLAAMLHPMDREGDEPEDGQSDERGIRGWGMMPLTMVVGLYGVDEFDGSLGLLRTMTPRWTSEFDVRYFLLADQDRALATMTGWLGDPDRHVRRLVSEGTRPRLPWGVQLPRLITDPSPTLPILTALRDDPEEYVRRSVANHLNDIAKDHPDLVVDLAADWIKGAPPQRLKLLRHACRTLIKRGHAGALKIFGFAPAKIRLDALTVEPATVTLGRVVDADLHDHLDQPNTSGVGYRHRPAFPQGERDPCAEGLQMDNGLAGCRRVPDPAAGPAAAFRHHPAPLRRRPDGFAAHQRP